MPDPSTFVAALYDAVLGGAGNGGAQPGASTYVTLEWPGLPLDPRQYGNVWASENPGGSAEALEWFSSLADDDMPALASLYQPGGVSLAQVYALMLQAAAPPGPLATAFASAQERFAEVARGSLQNPTQSYHPTWPAPRGWCDPGNEGLWTSVAIKPGAAPGPAPQFAAVRALLAQQNVMAWHLGSAAPPAPHGLAAMPQAPFLAPTALRTSMLALRPPMPAARPVTPMAVPMARAMMLNPGVLAGAMAGGAPAHAAVPVRPGLPGHPVLMPLPIFHPPLPTPVHVDNPPVSTSQLGASFKFIRVSLQRPWLDTTLFHLPGWSIGGLASGAISTGHADTNGGMLPLMTTGFIAAKDLTVSGTWSPADRNAAEQALSGKVAASFGPVTLAAGGRTLGSFDGSSISVPGIQIIAWTCSVLPLMPPN